MGTVAAPAAMIASSASVQSCRVSAKIETRSPAWTPAAMSPLAAARTCSANSLAVTSTQRPFTYR
jgi:hypothetical protein